MSTAESLPPTPDASSSEPTGTGRWLYAVDGDMKPMSSDDAETTPEETVGGSPLDEPKGEVKAEESGDATSASETTEGSDEDEERTQSSPNKTRGRLIKIGAGVATVITAIVGAVVATNNHNASPAPTPTIAGPKTPGPGATETASSQPTATETAEQGDNLKELGLPSIEEFQNMTLKEQEAAIEEALPESLLSDPEMVYRRFLGLEELIYNAPASDEAYRQYRDKGGLDYPSYIMDRWYNPLFKKLIGREPSTKLEDGAALTFAYRIANILNPRSQGVKDIFPLYRLTIEASSVEQPASPTSPYDIDGTISMHDTISPDVAEALAGRDFQVNVLDPAPVDFSMHGVHYDEDAGVIRASQLQ